jgi:hypothetical protein
MKDIKAFKMVDGISSFFSGEEIQKRQQIVSLMSDWQDEIAHKYKNEPDEEYWEGENPLSYFIADGFFPGYYSQKTKVVFIERETRFMDEYGDWVQHMIKSFKNNNNHNQKSFTRHLLYIVQGIKNDGRYKFENLEEANDYAKEIVDTNDYGFAFMNMSKYTNCTQSFKADYDFINQFLEDSNLENRNYFREEIEILSPDVIITGNLWNGGIEQKYLDLCFGKVEWEKINNDIDSKVNVSNIVVNSKSVKILNAYHLADYSHKDKEDFYDPIMEIIFNDKKI